MPHQSTVNKLASATFKLDRNGNMRKLCFNSQSVTAGNTAAMRCQAEVLSERKLLKSSEGDSCILSCKDLFYLLMFARPVLRYSSPI